MVDARDRLKLSCGLGMAANQYSGAAQVEESLSWRFIDDSNAARLTSAELAEMGRWFEGGADLDSALMITSILSSGNPATGGPVRFLVLADGDTTATGLGRDFALAGGIDSISVWITGGPADPQGHLGGVIGGGGAEARWIGDPAGYEEMFFNLLFAHFQNDDNTIAAASAGSAQAILGGGRFAFSDVNERLLRQRMMAAVPSPSLVRQPVGAKSPPEPVPVAAGGIEWSVFGSAAAGWQRGAARHGSVFGNAILLQAAHDANYQTATAGVEAAFGGNWTLGSVLIAHQADIDLGRLGDADDSAIGGAFYLSHRRALPRYALTIYGDVMVGWLDHRVDVDRRVAAGIARGRTDADTRVLEIHVGATRADGPVLHGPEIGLSALRGGIDAFRESGAANGAHASTDFSSTLLRLGYHGAVRLHAGNVPLTLSAGTAWEHEFDGTTVGPRGAEGIGSMARDTWLAQLALRAELRESLSVYSVFESRLARRTDSQLLKLGCQLTF